MKNILIFLFSVISLVGFTQDEGEDPVQIIVDKEAEFDGGIEQMKLFIEKNLRYSPSFGCVQGRAAIRVVVEKDGTLSNIQVIKGIPNCSECNEEAIRVVRLMPPFVPAEKYGTIVRSYYNFPISFKIH